LLDAVTYGLRMHRVAPVGADDTHH